MTIFCCLYRGMGGKIMVKCSSEHHLSSKLVTKHVLSGLAASLIFLSQTNQVSNPATACASIIRVLIQSYNISFTTWNMVSCYAQNIGIGAGPMIILGPVYKILGQNLLLVTFILSLSIQILRRLLKGDTLAEQWEVTFLYRSPAFIGM